MRRDGLPERRLTMKFDFGFRKKYREKIREQLQEAYNLGQQSGIRLGIRVERASRENSGVILSSRVKQDIEEILQIPEQTHIVDPVLLFDLQQHPTKRGRGDNRN